MTPNGLCGIIEQHKLNPHTHPNDCFVHIFTDEAQLNGSTGKQKTA